MKRIEKLACVLIAVSCSLIAMSFMSGIVMLLLIGLCVAVFGIIAFGLAVKD